jgi:hypothetical protein
MLHPGGAEKARERAKDFFSLASSSMQGIGYSDAKDAFNISSNQVETRKSLFEEIGLLYVPRSSNQIILTEIGRQLFELIDGGTASSDRKGISRATALLAFALSKCQVNRPQSRGSPRLSDAEVQSCMVRPYAVLWQAIHDLDGKLHLHEFMGPLRRMWVPDEYTSVLEEIRDARRQGRRLASTDELTGRDEMNYRIYWRSHMSLGETILSYDADMQTMSVVPNQWPIVEAVLQFHSGCAGNTTDLFAARPWKDIEDYYRNLAGSACPPFLSTGSPKIVDFQGQAIADLRSYKIEKRFPNFFITAGPELCNLALLLPCFHPSEQNHLLRVDRKESLPNGQIRIRFGAGRPITNVDRLKKAFGEDP